MPIDLGVLVRLEGKGHEHFLCSASGFANVSPDRGRIAGEVVFVFEALVDSLGGVALLPQLGLVLRKPRVDDRLRRFDVRLAALRENATARGMGVATVLATVWAARLWATRASCTAG